MGLDLDPGQGLLVVGLTAASGLAAPAPNLTFPSFGSGALLTYTPVYVAVSAASGTAAGSLTSPLTGPVFSITAGNVTVNTGTGDLTLSAVAPNGGAIPFTASVHDAAGLTTSTQAFSILVGAAPLVTAQPSLSTNAPVVGIPVSATAGTYSGSPAPTVTRQWFYGDTGAPITGATGLSYTPVSADVGHSLRYVETATNVDGSAGGTAPTTMGVTAASSSVPALSILDSLGSPIADLASSFIQGTS